jgi:ribosome recycling factor
MKTTTTLEDEISFCIENATEQMDNAIEHFKVSLGKLKAGKANPQMLDGLFVEYYGVNTPLSQVSTISTPDARTIMIQPYEKSLVENIEKAINIANLGLTPQNDGKVVRINIPMLTEERRRDLVKKVKAEAENCRVSIRTIRREANETVKSLAKKGLPEDQAKNVETKIQQLTDSFNTKVDATVAVKEQDIMTV